ncbi:hypothetical protein DIURU_001276 [Diutina rugosa]|uniref:F-box domain-containing protein n=1 Tax=Diutina rugosa TaxID=5481 RepID=A0A642UWP0_DIURU|nr:uncharacterized protein DIURU_001276 [Diutina rugosa]KAA8905899.1 hypothetical protein DIURU_001276 [Diutina rugosa]
MAGFLDLPDEIQRLVCSFADTPDVCRAYLALAPRGQVVLAYLNDVRVVVTPAPDPFEIRSIIDFDFLKQLPPCRLKVILPTKDCGPIPEWFKQRKYPSVHVVFKEGGQPIQVHDWASHIDTFEFEWLKDFEYHCGSATRAVFKDCADFFITGDKLESFEASGNISGVRHIPLNIKKLVFDSYTEIDVSKFPNLIHLRASKPLNVPWSQLQTYSGDAKPISESLDDMVEFASVADGAFSFKNIHCPKLEKVSLRANYSEREEYEITSLFTEAQMARLTSFMAPQYVVRDITPFVSLKVWSTLSHDEITGDFAVPPSLVELHIASYQPVRNIPPQLKKFSFLGKGDWYGGSEGDDDVTVASPNLRELKVQQVPSVRVNCPRLTRLDFVDVFRVSAISAPSLVDLEYCGYNPFPFDTTDLPRLAILHLSDKRESLVLERHLKSIILNGVELSDMRVNADFVRVLCSTIMRPPRNDGGYMHLCYSNITWEEVIDRHVYAS